MELPDWSLAALNTLPASWSNILEAAANTLRSTGDATLVLLADGVMDVRDDIRRSTSAVLGVHMTIDDCAMHLHVVEAKLKGICHDPYLRSKLTQEHEFIVDSACRWVIASIEAWTYLFHATQKETSLKGAQAAASILSSMQAVRRDIGRVTHSLSGTNELVDVLNEEMELTVGLIAAASNAATMNFS